MAVVLVDGDRVGRTTLARALLRGECEVMVADLPADLEAALDAADPVDVALVDANHPAAIAIVELLAQRRPGVPLVVRTGDPVGTLARLAQVTAAKIDVRPRHAAADELIDAMRRTLAG
jgi:DNA-binding NtrC family response regulator